VRVHRVHASAVHRGRCSRSGRRFLVEMDPVRISFVQVCYLSLPERAETALISFIRVRYPKTSSSGDEGGHCYAIIRLHSSTCNLNLTLQALCPRRRESLVEQSQRHRTLKSFAKWPSRSYQYLTVFQLYMVRSMYRGSLHEDCFVDLSMLWREPLHS